MCLLKNVAIVQNNECYFQNYIEKAYEIDRNYFQSFNSQWQYVFGSTSQTESIISFLGGYKFCLSSSARARPMSSPRNGVLSLWTGSLPPSPDLIHCPFFYKARAPLSLCNNLHCPNSLIFWLCWDSCSFIFAPREICSNLSYFNVVCWNLHFYLIVCSPLPHWHGN